jgi:leucyl/phenylalanyl-tRNA---protein transferase
MSVSESAAPATTAAQAARRALLFRETLSERLERWTLGTAWALKPERIHTVPALAQLWVADLVSPARGLPDPLAAPDDHQGLCGIVHDLSVPTLLEAYGRGLYTFAHFGPLKWFCPPERCVLFFPEAHVGKTVRRALRQQRYRVTFDRDFEGVIKACAGRRDGKWHVTWITPRIMRAYADLYDAGHVHSFEVWNAEDELVGGGYGVALGSVFFTESQFSIERDTSKLGFTVLNWHLARWGFSLNDGKGATPTILPMGFRDIPRAEFVDHLRYAAQAPGKAGRWEVEADLPTIAEWQPQAARQAAASEPRAQHAAA